MAGLTKGDWCPINPADFSSKIAKDVYVLGDSSIAKSMPKSGFSANSQAKVVANAVQAALAGKKKFPARFRNTCWSLISDNDGVKVGASYKAGSAKVDVTSKFISKVGEPADLRANTFKESEGWYAGITAEIFAKS
jgi:NADH dehydrogenase FAD-containing subunit